jgi:3',5'-cyclic AMP phosphodiesterase CpdA
MVLLAQISDVRLGPLPPVTAGDLASKRLLGYLNWRRNRARKHDDAVLAALLADMSAARPDHIAVTGDLVNLGLPAEYPAASDWLTALGSPEQVTAIPGNHDAYVPGALDHAVREWAPWMTGDGEAAQHFPFLRRREPLALIGLSSAVATAPLMATGTLGAAQLAALARLLETTRVEGLFRVVLVHHPVTEGAPWHRALTDAGRLRETVAHHGAELILHGHDHHTTVASVAGLAGPVPVIGAAAASLRPRPERAGGSYNLFGIEGSAGNWHVTMRERRIQPDGSVATASERELAIPGRARP